MKRLGRTRSRPPIGQELPLSGQELCVTGFSTFPLETYSTYQPSVLRVRAGMGIITAPSCVLGF